MGANPIALQRHEDRFAAGEVLINRIQLLLAFGADCDRDR